MHHCRVAPAVAYYGCSSAHAEIIKPKQQSSAFRLPLATLRTDTPGARRLIGMHRPRLKLMHFQETAFSAHRSTAATPSTHKTE